MARTYTHGSQKPIQTIHIPKTSRQTVKILTHDVGHHCPLYIVPTGVIRERRVLFERQKSFMSIKTEAKIIQTSRTTRIVWMLHKPKQKKKK